MTGEVQFFDPGELIERELSLHLVETYKGNAQIGWAPAYRFELRIDQGLRTVGHITLRLSHSPDIERFVGHIGYDVEPAYRGHRYAARACKLLLPLAARHGLNPLWITCNPDNVPSRRTCERMGAYFVDTVSVPPNHDMFRILGERQKCRYRLDLN